MVLKESLNHEMIEAGKTLIDRLDEKGEAIPTALWLYSEEANLWRLMLATPLVKSKGPRAAYKSIRSVLTHYQKEEPFSLTLSDITVVAPDDAVLEPFRVAFKTSGTAGVRLSRTTVGGRFIDDAYVYRAA